MIRILRDSRGYFYVRLSCPCGCSRTTMAATLEAAVGNWRLQRKIERNGGDATRGRVALGKVRRVDNRREVAEPDEHAARPVGRVPGVPSHRVARARA